MTFARAARRLLLGLCVVSVCAGCVTTVDGSARRAEPIRPAAPVSLEQVLPTEEEIGTAVGNTLGQNGFPAQVGGIDVLPDGLRDDSEATPIECLGAITSHMRVAYEKGTVRAAAVVDYWNYGGDVLASSANVGAVQLSSSADAQQLFGSFVAQWQKCAGRTVVVHTPDTELYSQVTDVKLEGPILSATIMGWDNHHTPPFPNEHAVGVKADVIVDVDVAVTGGSRDQRVAGTRAIDIAKLMLDKVANTS